MAVMVLWSRVAAVGNERGGCGISCLGDDKQPTSKMFCSRGIFRRLQTPPI
jgi:hypothetical protein